MNCSTYRLSGIYAKTRYRKKWLIVERKMKEDKQTREQILSFIVMATYLNNHTSCP